MLSPAVSAESPSEESSEGVWAPLAHRKASLAHRYQHPLPMLPVASRCLVETVAVCMCVEWCGRNGAGGGFTCACAQRCPGCPPSGQLPEG